MSRAVTVQKLIDEIRWQADALGLTLRHPDSNIITDINRSWQTAREKVSDNGHQLYLKPFFGTMTAGPYVDGSSNTYNFGRVPMPADCIRVYGVDVQVNGVWRNLEPIAFERRNEFRDAYGVNTGLPVAFHIWNAGVENGATVTVGSIAIHPAPSGAYPYQLWYLPSWTDVTNTANVIDGFANWDQYVVWDCVIRLCARDDDSKNAFLIANQERASALADMLKGANSVQRAGPETRLDTAARNRANRRYAFWRRP